MGKKSRLSDMSGSTKAAFTVLAVGLIIKTASNILNIALGSFVTVPLEWFDFLTSVCVFTFLLICVFSLTPIGFVFFSISGAILCMGVYLLIWGIGVAIIGMILSGIVSALLSFVLIGGYTIGFTFVVTSVTVFTFTPVLIPAVSVAPLTAGAAVAAGLAGGANTAASKHEEASPGKRIASVLINLILLLVVGIPLLSAATGLSGPFRSKPGHILGLQLLNRFNLITAEESVSRGTLLSAMGEKTFTADIDVFKNGTLNCLQNTKEYNIAVDDVKTSILHGGVLHVYDSESQQVLIQEACPVPNGPDTVVLHTATTTFVLGNEELFILQHLSYDNITGHYFRSRYPWRKAYLELTEAEQFDRIYEILSRGKKGAPLQEAALIKLSAQKGQLVHYDFDRMIVYFASPKDDGTVTFYEQTGPGERREFATVKAHMESGRIPYLWDSREEYIVCVNGSELTGVWPDGYVSEPYPMHGREILSINSLYDKNGMFCMVDLTPDKLYIFDYSSEQWIHMDVDPEITKCSTGILSNGNSIYCYYYPNDDLIRKYTYLKDMSDFSGESFKKRYIESHYHGLRYLYYPLDSSGFDR